MNVAHDVYSETNPAYCAFALGLFVGAFATVNDKGPELPLAYLVLPLALSTDLAPTFEATNKNTGLLVWLDRSPQIQVGLAADVNASMDIVTDAISFGCFSGILAIHHGARLQRGPRKIKKSIIGDLSEGPARALKRAERLGYWFATAGSTKTVLDMMALVV